MSIAVNSIGEGPVSAQPPSGAKRVMNAAPANRRAIAKADTSAQPEAR